MSAKSMDLAWIVVKDLKEAVKFYTEVVGLKLSEIHEQFGWAELAGPDGGSRLGIAQAQHEPTVAPGSNAVVTFSVSHIEQVVENFLKKGAECVGKIQEIPGHVKLQMVRDKDGNYFQLAEMIAK
ncbi:MAG: VOC family protein [Verrucomicrobia bacterium]|nr:VOC family protein [Verrucomicrobiota bacterium]